MSSDFVSNTMILNMDPFEKYKITMNPLTSKKKKNLFLIIILLLLYEYLKNDYSIIALSLFCD